MTMTDKPDPIEAEIMEVPSTSVDDEIDLIRLLRLLMGSWKLIFGSTMLAALASVIFALLQPEVYEAEILLALAEEEETSMASSLTQFGGLAAMTGLSIPSDSNKEQVIASLHSRKFLCQFISEENLLPVLFKNQWDENRSEWKVETEDEIPSMEDAYRLFLSQVMIVHEDKTTGLFTLSVFWKNPELTAEWANGLVRRLNEELQSKAIEGSKKRIGYLEKEVAKTTAKGMLAVLYSLIESEKQKEMLANVNEEFALEVIDPAVVPEYRAKPNRKLIVVVGAISGFFLGLFIFFMREFMRKLMNPVSVETSA